MEQPYLTEHALVARHLAAAPALPVPPAPKGGTPAAVRKWFDAVADIMLPASVGTLADEHDAADAFRQLAKADNTRRAYRAAVAAWCAWCAARDVPALPASSRDVAAFLAGERLRGLKPNTLDLRRAAIRYLHRTAGCAVPTDDTCVAETVAGIRREAAKKGEFPQKKAAATSAIIEQILAHIPDDLRGLRDRALLLVGFAGALRRSELIAIACQHLETSDQGIRLTLPVTKGSQTAAVTIPLPYGQTGLCPVLALRRWLDAASLSKGPVFRRIWTPPEATAADQPPALPRIGHAALSTRAVASIIQSRAAAAGFEPRDFGGHSLKRGALTTGMRLGVHPAKLKQLGRHKSFDVLGEYLEFGDRFDDHPLKGVL